VTAAISGVQGSYAPQAMSGASSTASPSQKMSDVFASVTTRGSGVITQDQFNTAFNSGNTPPAFQQLGANAVFAQLDPNGTGSVSRQDFIQGMTQLMAQLNG
jgi:Ca2+-binding EF-hand superfamily protein